MTANHAVMLWKQASVAAEPEDPRDHVILCSEGLQSQGRWASGGGPGGGHRLSHSPGLPPLHGSPPGGPLCSSLLVIHSFSG